MKVLGGVNYCGGPVIVFLLLIIWIYTFNIDTLFYLRKKKFSRIYSKQEYQKHILYFFFFTEFIFVLCLQAVHYNYFLGFVFRKNCSKQYDESQKAF